MSQEIPLLGGESSGARSRGSDSSSWVQKCIVVAVVINIALTAALLGVIVSFAAKASDFSLDLFPAADAPLANRLFHLDTQGLARHAQDQINMVQHFADAMMAAMGENSSEIDESYDAARQVLNMVWKFNPLAPLGPNKDKSLLGSILRSVEEFAAVSSSDVEQNYATLGASCLAFAQHMRQTQFNDPSVYKIFGAAPMPVVCQIARVMEAGCKAWVSADVASKYADIGLCDEGNCYVQADCNQCSSRQGCKWCTNNGCGKDSDCEADYIADKCCEAFESAENCCELGSKMDKCEFCSSSTQPMWQCVFASEASKNGDAFCANGNFTVC